MDYPNTNSFLFTKRDPDAKLTLPKSKPKKLKAEEVRERIDRRLKSAILEDFESSGIGEFAEEFAARVR